MRLHGQDQDLFKGGASKALHVRHSPSSMKQGEPGQSGPFPSGVFRSQGAVWSGRPSGHGLT